MRLRGHHDKIVFEGKVYTFICHVVHYKFGGFFCKFSSVRDRQSKQSARLSLQSSELAPPLHLHSSVAPPTFGSKKGGTHKLKGEGGG
jgi:hypothetical protein